MFILMDFLRISHFRPLQQVARIARIHKAIQMEIVYSNDDVGGGAVRVAGCCWPGGWRCHR